MIKDECRKETLILWAKEPKNKHVFEEDILCFRGKLSQEYPHLLAFKGRYFSNFEKLVS